MAKPKVKKNDAFKKLYKNLDKIMADMLNVHGRRVNARIQKGIDNGVDVNDKPFKPLSKVTGAMRIAKQGHYAQSGGGGILNYTGKMKETSIDRATRKNPVYKITMEGKSSRTGTYYGALHNTGFKNSSKKTNWFPKATIPKRRWFGFPKGFAIGGKEWKKAVLEIKMRIKNEMKSPMKNI